MGSFCADCGKEIPENGVCPCTQQVQPAQVNQPAAAAQEPVMTSEPVMPSANTPAQPSAGAQFASSLFDFFKVFVSQPVAAMQKCAIGVKEAAVFFAVQPLMLFIALIAMSSKMFGSLVQLDTVGLFLRTYVYCIAAMAALLGLAILFFKAMGKGKLDILKLFTLGTIALLPLTASYLLMMIFFFFSFELALTMFAVGVIASLVLSVFAFAIAFGVSFEKSAIFTICTFSAQTLIIILFVSNSINNLIGSALGSLGAFF